MNALRSLAKGETSAVDKRSEHDFCALESLGGCVSFHLMLYFIHVSDFKIVTVLILAEICSWERYILHYP